MGVIWLQTTSGCIIHLPIVGPDVNAPNSPIKISTSAISVSQISSGTTLPIIIDGYGEVTLDFSIPERIGSCVKCGACCTHPVECCTIPDCKYILDMQYDVHKCRYLNINAGEDKLGTPGQAICSIYDNIMNISKGCLYGPQNIEEMQTWMSNCGFEFKE